MSYSKWEAKFKTNDEVAPSTTCTNLTQKQRIVENNAFGLYICGKRGGLPFKKVIRPDRNSNFCPLGT
jgi:hypothetical protein